MSELFDSVFNYVDAYAVCDDGSTDNTIRILGSWQEYCTKPFKFTSISHTGLPETVKHKALQLVDTEWVLMLDCDERLSSETLSNIRTFIHQSYPIDYVYFRQHEIIDGRHVRTFQKCKLFKKASVQFPLNNIHADDQFTGNGTYMDNWVVEHRKTTQKQIQREKEYLSTYNKLFEEGHIDSGRREWLRNLHHYIKEEPHG